MVELSPAVNTAAELRNAFDRARAVPHSLQAAEQTEKLLAVRVCGDPYVIRISEISGIAHARKIVGLPSTIPEQLGLAGVHGSLVPVYSLAGLLGYSTETAQAKWLALCGVEEPFGLALNDLEGYLMVPLAQIDAAQSDDVTRPHARHMVRTGDAVRAVISIAAIREAIQRRFGIKSESKER